MAEEQTKEAGTTNAEKLRSELRRRQEQHDAEKKAPKKDPGTYDHTDEHTRVYGAMGIEATDSPIDRAWARLEDKHINIGPAMTDAIEKSEGVFVQYFMYAKAMFNKTTQNVNHTVMFKTGGTGQVHQESGI
jgi:hypothetical protein